MFLYDQASYPRFREHKNQKITVKTVFWFLFGLIISLDWCELIMYLILNSEFVLLNLICPSPNPNSKYL